MSRNSMRSIRLLSWRFLRWAIAIPTLPLIWWACTSHPLAQPTPAPEQQTDIYISVSPQRLLDLVFMVDNSPSMAPKVTKMNAQFPRLIEALRDPNDDTLPDLRVAVISSDLGTGCAYGSGSCGPKDPATGQGCWGDQGKFQMLKSPTACTFNDGAQFLEYKAGAAVNYSGDINNVFACLASNLGTLGCGEEHVLQAFEFALAAKGVGTEEQQAAFLRGNAYLGLVFLADEDDCSAALNIGLFGDRPELRTESASLRCATRAHMCGGQNLSTTGPNYPTNAAFENAFADCKARTDTCPNQTDGYPENTDASGPTGCAPFKNIRHLAEEIKGLKADPENQILVAGIFGWPMGEPDSQAFKDNMAAAKYKIAQVPNPNTADTQHPQVYDYWPVCYDPDHQPRNPDSTTGFDADAAGWGAMGGLREAAFIDEFGENGLKFSICERDFTRAMNVIGNAIAKKLQNLCVDYKLIDTDTSAAGVQADCRVVWRKPEPDPKDSTKVIYVEDPESMPQCPPGSTQGNVPEDCWQLTSDRNKCPVNGQLIQVLRTADEIRENPQVPAGTKVGMQCRTCTDTIPGAPVTQGCDYTL
jgi:hypothetical protein